MKQEKYALVRKNAEALLSSEKDLIANLANISALLKEHFDFWWVGFYLVKGDQLVLGPFQGPIACTRIGFGKGVCGKAWEQKQSIIVPDVHAFEGHIACNSESNSELVIPIFYRGEVKAVLDIDSREFNHFDETDRQEMEQLCVQLSNFFA